MMNGQHHPQQQQQQQQPQQKQHKQIQMTPALEKLIDSLCLRFLSRVPEEDLKPPERIFFTIEQMYWYYLDFHKREKEREQQEQQEQDQDQKKKNKKGGERFPSLTMGELARLIFRRFAPFRALENDVPILEKRFRKYKVRVPVCGGVLLNSDLTRCLMVRGCQRSLWSFPAGKINKDETEMECAVREVLEETGFDGKNFVLEGDCIDFPDNRRPIKLFIMPGVPDHTTFQPRTRGEIEEIEWHPVAWLSGQRDYLLEKTGVQQLFAWIHKNRFNFERLQMGVKGDKRDQERIERGGGGGGGGEEVEEEEEEEEEEVEEEEEGRGNLSYTSPCASSSSSSLAPPSPFFPSASSPQSSPSLQSSSPSSPAVSSSGVFSSPTPTETKLSNFQFDVSAILSTFVPPPS